MLLFDHVSCQTRSVMAPAWGFKHVTNSILKTEPWLGNVFGDCDPFVKFCDQDVERNEVFNNVVSARLFRIFRNKSTKYFVPYYEDARIISIEVLGNSAAVESRTNRGHIAKQLLSCQGTTPRK